MAKKTFASTIIAPILNGISSIFGKDDDEEEKKRKEEEERKNKAQGKTTNPAPVKKTYTIADSSPLAPITKNTQQKTTQQSSSQQKKQNVAPIAEYSATSPMNEMQWRTDTVPGMTEAIKDNIQPTFFKEGSGSAIDKILGTAADAAENVATGFLSFGESAVDSLLTLGSNLGKANLAQANFNMTYSPYAATKKGREMASGIVATNNALQKKSDETVSNVIKSDIINEQQIAQKYITKPFEEKAGINAQKASVIGEMGAKALQSAGQLVTQVGLTALGVPSSLSIGLSSFGGEMENALKQGATLEEATVSSMISATGEILSERLSGGIKLGGKTLDEKILDPFIDKISNDVVRNIVNIGADAFGEGLEEIFSGVISNFGSALYKEESIGTLINSAEARKEYVESFLIGSLLGGTSSTAKATINTVSDIVREKKENKLTSNEQKVVDTEIESRMKELEDSGEKIKRSKVHKEVMKDLEEGLISIDTIERALGGETYKKYKEAIDNEDAVKNEFDVLNKMKQGDMTGEQSDRRNELKKQLEEMNNSTVTADLKKQLGDEVFNISKSTRLEESYREVERGKQAFTDDLSKYDEKQGAIVKAAIESGVLNNTNKSHRFVDFVAKICADKGITFDFTNNRKLQESAFAVEGRDVSGYVMGNNVTINVSSKRMLNSVVGHEVMHVLKGTDLYVPLTEALTAYSKSIGEYSSRLENTTKLYEGMDADINEELFADMVGDYIFSDEDFVRKLSTENRNVFEKVYDEIKYLCKTATTASDEGRQLLKAKHIFEKMYREEVDIKNTTDEGGVKYSIINTSKMTLKEQLNLLYKNELKTSDSLYLGITPSTVSASGLEELPLAFPTNNYNKSRKIKHNVPRRSIKELNKNLENALFSFGNEQKVGFILPDVDADGKQLLVGIEKGLMDRKPTNIIKSIYGIDNPAEWIQNQINEGKSFVLYNEKEANSFLQTYGYSASVEEGIKLLKDSITSDTKNVKKKQLEIIEKVNPAPNTYSAWVRSVEDIKTLSETLEDSEWADYDEFNPDLSRDMIEEAIESGQITVYSSYPIEQGVFVSPSYMEAESYSGTGKVYEKTVNIEDVAWLDPTQGMYANTTEDGKFSLSAPVRTETKRRARDIYGDDVSLDTSENIAPVREDIKKADSAEPVKVAVTEQKKIAPVKEDMKASDKEKKFTTLDIIDDDIETEVKSEEAEVKSEDVSSKPVTIKDKALDNIAKTVRKALSLTPAEKKTAAEIIQRYAESGKRDIAALAEELKSNFAERSYKERVEEIADVKHALKGQRIFVPQYIKNGIADYSDFRRRNFGKLTLANEGMSVDKVYEGLSYAFPNFFPSDIENDIDRLLQMSEVAGMETYKDGVDFLSDESITEAAELIDDVVNTYKEKSYAEEAERERKESERKAERERKKLLIRKNMSNEERTELLRQKTVENVAVVNNAFPTPNIENFKWEDIDKVAGKEKRSIINKLAKEFGAFKEYTNKDIELTFNFSKNNFQESYGKQKKNFQNFAKMLSVFDKVIESAVGIEAHNRNEEGYKYDPTLKNVYVLLSAFENGENIVPVKLEIKEFNDKDNTLYVAVALETIKKTEVSGQGNTENGVTQNSRSVNISIPDLISKINPKDTGFTKYVPKGMLTEEQVKELGKSERTKYHDKIIEDFKSTFAKRGFNLDEVLAKAKNMSTLRINDNTPQRVMKKTFGPEEGDILADLTVNKVAQNESEGIKWLNSFLDKKSGLLAKIAEQHKIKPGSDESAAAQMYAEGFYVNEADELVEYGDKELMRDFKDPVVREHIKNLASDERIRKIYDETLEAINESRRRNLYPEIPRLDNYFLHFREMGDTFSRIGVPLNTDVIRADNLPTNINGQTIDLKPGQPYFASAKHREGKRTTFDLLGGLEKYLTSAKNQIYHIDDIQNLRALRNYIAETYGEAQGVRNLDTLSEEQIHTVISENYNKHLSNFAMFLSEEANHIAGKKPLIDRGSEGWFGRVTYPLLNALNKQFSNNVLGLNIGTPLTNFLSVAQAFAKTNKFDFFKGFTQTVTNKLKTLNGTNDDFAENSPVIIRRKGAEQFYRKPYEKITDAGYFLMGLTDDISTEIIARAKYNELTRKGMDSQKAHFETDKWVSALMGDRSLGQIPLMYNSKVLGQLTKFQLEVRNQLDSQFYDTIQEAKLSNKDIENKLERNAKTAAKITSTVFQLAVAQHVFGQCFEQIAGYNPAFDIIEVIATALGLDDEEDDEDTVLDNIEEAFFALLEDLPYTSIVTGGRLPLSNMLPVQEFINGKDEYGNEKSRLKTLKETAPYYLFPMGYGQIKKTVKGLQMFSDKHPISGSYTDSGNLRFPVEKTPGNVLQAAVFGQYANENAREYFDKGYAPLKEKQIQEYIDVDMPISEYREYREGLSGLKTLNEKGDYIGGLKLPVSKKNILINNIADRDEPIDMTDYKKYKDFEEFDFAQREPETYKVLEEQGISVKDYKEKHEKKVMINTDDFSWAATNPDKYAVSKAVAGDVLEYKKYTSELSKFEADKDKNGESINGTKKKKQKEYIFGLPLEYGQKIILYRSLFSSKEDKRTYNNDIIDYLESREDLSYEDKVAILTELDFTVDENGYVKW